MIIRSLLVATLCALALAGCGRKAPLDKPSVAAGAEPAQTAPKDPGAVNPDAPDKPFILDGLL